VVYLTLFRQWELVFAIGHGNRQRRVKIKVGMGIAWRVRSLESDSEILFNGRLNVHDQFYFTTRRLRAGDEPG
jgi:hypothetical protein